MHRLKKILGRALIVLVVAAVITGLAVVTINGHIVNKEKENIIASVTSGTYEFSDSEAMKIKELNADCVIVLGAGIIDSETPSAILKDRLDVGIKLYKEGLVKKILLTGDNGTEAHNEIHVMLNYTLAAGVPSEDIFCDHAGFSTYDSMYRAKEIFHVESAIIVTQSYHEYRSLYLGEKLGMKVEGVASDQDKYQGQYVREIREVLARVKDVFKAMLDSKSSVGGEAIPINGSGIVSHGE